VAFAYALGVIKDRTGSFAWGFGVICISCLIGIGLSFVLAGIRRRGLEAKVAR
jgi:hypothetical protein